MVNYQSYFSADAGCMQFSAIRRMAQLSSRQGVISLSAGAPNAATFPVNEIREITGAILAGVAPEALQYGLTLGFDGLIEAVLEFSHQRRIPSLNRHQVAITSGSQQALDLLGRVLVDPGDTVFFELPSYVGAISVFRNLQARLVGIRQEADGIDLDDLDNKIARCRQEGHHPKLAYIIPNFQNPSGVSLSLGKRQQLIEVARRREILIIEDDPYGEIFFNGEVESRPAPVKSYDRHGIVIYVSTFSKILAPGLRTGWILAAPALIEKLELAKQATDLCGSMLDQRVVAECWKQGVIQRHLPAIRAFYRSKCRVMLDSLGQYMPPEVKWTAPEGGLFLWVILPAPLKSEEILVQCIDQEKVSYVIGQPFHVDGTGSNTLRLAFSKENEINIALGVQRFARVLKSRLG
jgi:2-aminoadipate transaminase